MKVLVLAAVVAVVAGRSIDNPAENPHEGGVGQAALVKDGRSLAVPPPVQVSSSVVTVVGGARQGRVIEIGADGIPIIHGVRVPDSPDDDPRIYRNARIIHNKLVTDADDDKFNSVEGRANTHRQPRVLAGQSQTQAGFSPSLGPEGPQLPPFYRHKYLNKERAGVVAESYEEDDNLSTSSEQVVSYSYLAAPQDSGRAKDKAGKDVVYGSGSAAKPPGQLSASPSSVISVPAKPEVKSLPVAVQAESAVHVNAVPPTPALSSASSNFAVHHEDSSSFQPSPAHHAPATHHAPAGPVHAHGQFFHAPATAPPNAPSTVFQANPSNFVIRDSTFQAHPGAPTFNIPIPIPQEHLRQQDGYITYHQDELAAHHAAATKKPIYQKMMEPFRKAGQRFYEMARPIFSPVMNAGQRFSERLRLPERVSTVYDTFGLERTGDGGSLPLIAGAAAIGLVGLVGLAVAANNNVTLIGKRSVDDPAQEFAYQLLDSLPLDEGSLLDTIEGYTGTWSDSGCSKRLFCDLASLAGDDSLYTIEKRLGFFLEMLNHGREEESALQRSAGDVMSAVRRRECRVFTCGGEDVDSSKVSRKAAGPR